MIDKVKEIRRLISILKSTRVNSNTAFKRFFLRNCLYEIETLGGFLAFNYYNQEEFYNKEIDFLSPNYLKVQNKIKDYEILLKVPFGLYSYETLKDLIKYRVSYAYLRTDEEYSRLGIDKSLGEREVACNIYNKQELLNCWHYICDKSIRFPPNCVEIAAFSSEYRMLQDKEIKNLIDENEALKKRVTELERRLRIDR